MCKRLKIWIFHGLVAGVLKICNIRSVLIIQVKQCNFNLLDNFNGGNHTIQQIFNDKKGRLKNNGGVYSKRYKKKYF